jgi:hypothetical protein
MHSARDLQTRYLRGLSSPGEINAIARTYATLRGIPFQQALEEVHDGMGYELSTVRDGGEQPFPWAEVSRSLIPLGRQWINGV